MSKTDFVRVVGAPGGKGGTFRISYLIEEGVLPERVWFPFLPIGASVFYTSSFITVLGSPPTVMEVPAALAFRNKTTANSIRNEINQGAVVTVLEDSISGFISQIKSGVFVVIDPLEEESVVLQL